MRKMISKYELKIDEQLYDFINNEVLPDTNIKQNLFWSNFSNLIMEFAPVNKELLNKRNIIQKKLNTWYEKKLGKGISNDEYKNFLREIGYIVEEGNDFKIDTNNVDDEISQISGPQLVVPITNARYALNAVNARWGSLYDSLYGTDVLGNLPKNTEYDIERGNKVIEYAKNHLDKITPIKSNLNGKKYS